LLIYRSYNEFWWYRARILEREVIEGVPSYHVGFYGTTYIVFRQLFSVTAVGKVGLFLSTSCLNFIAGFLKSDTEWIPVNSPRYLMLKL
jgi:hypothetical protein